ncbi:hypothetical protein ZIOFF_026867 [Zingiber officinale]|uniref:Jacalin-type lectin domain-containing protein n=1 Tax=Zingiber officinale TaxID=94328 RepID=A0A8J5LKT2_ZINOF|nr:hypothetical protein ZIOFF_026867 [Zingiber officinale]
MSLLMKNMLEALAMRTLSSLIASFVSPIVRDKHIYPIQVITWKELTELDKQHMWDAVKVVPPIKIKIGPWGGLGAGGFDVGQYVSHITKVKLYTGDVVDSLEISYVDDRNQFETYRTGGGGGGLHEFELESGEYINWVVASYKDYYDEICLTELGFKTNLGKEHGPFGDGGGETVTIPVVAGRLVGFFGQYDRYINSIGLYLAPY